MRYNTKRYSIRFDFIETDMSLTIRISAEDFKNNFKFLTQQVADTKDDDCPMTYRTRTAENDTTTATYHYFQCGTATTLLVEYCCKKGYHFKNKG